MFRIVARHAAPRASVRAQPLQHLEIPPQRRFRARQFVPRAVVRARPLQHLEVPAVRRVRARQLVARAAVRARPLQQLEIPAQRRVLTDLRTCVTTMSLSRPEIASPALASLRSRFLWRARVSTPSVAVEDIAEGGVCAWLCVGLPRRDGVACILKPRPRKSRRQSCQ